MKAKLVKESLNEQEKSLILNKDELDYTYFSEVKNVYTKKFRGKFYDAINALGIDEKDAVFISSWNESVDWDELLKELDNNNISYSFIDGFPDDDFVVFNVHDLK